MKSNIATNLIPINTVFSVASTIDLDPLNRAKLLMNEKYANKYTYSPHITYAITPIKQENFENARHDLEKLVNSINKFRVKISSIKLESEKQFFYLELVGHELFEIHKSVTILFNKHRDNCIRAKDLVKLQNGEFSKKDCEYIEKYGYSRVFDNFKSHITIGNVNIENPDLVAIEEELHEILKPIENTELEIYDIRGFFHTDSDKGQSEMQEMWKGVYGLRN